MLARSIEGELIFPEHVVFSNFNYNYDRSSSLSEFLRQMQAGTNKFILSLLGCWHIIALLDFNFSLLVICMTDTCASCP